MSKTRREVRGRSCPQMLKVGRGEGGNLKMLLKRDGISAKIQKAGRTGPA